MFLRYHVLWLQLASVKGSLDLAQLGQNVPWWHSSWATVFLGPHMPWSQHIGHRAPQQGILLLWHQCALVTVCLSHCMLAFLCLSLCGWVTAALSHCGPLTPCTWVIDFLACFGHYIHDGHHVAGLPCTCVTVCLNYGSSGLQHDVATMWLPFAKEW